MGTTAFPVIDLTATGNNIRRLRQERGLSVRDLQSYFGFEEPRAIYKWQKGESLPTVDNLYALGAILGVPMDRILVPVSLFPITNNEQQADACCSHRLKRLFSFLRRFRQRQASTRPHPFFRSPAGRETAVWGKRTPGRGDRGKSCAA